MPDTRPETIMNIHQGALVLAFLLRTEDTEWNAEAHEHTFLLNKSDCGRSFLHENCRSGVSLYVEPILMGYSEWSAVLPRAGAYLNRASHIA